VTAVQGPCIISLTWETVLQITKV